MTPTKTTDHDLLITVNVKLDNLSVDVKNMGDTMTKELNDHEARLKVIELAAQKYDTDGMVKRLNMVEQKLHDFETTTATFRVMAGVVGGMIMFVLTQLPNILRLVGIIK